MMSTIHGSVEGNPLDLASVDYAVVGAGSAGSIVAANLARRYPERRIVLIEAGPRVPESDSVVWDPTQWLCVGQQQALEWGYQSTPQPQLHDRVIPMGRAKGLGGCALHNAMVYVRGGRPGFDAWERELGCAGWAYAEVVPYFEAVERRLHVTTAATDPFVQSLALSASRYGLPYRQDYNRTPGGACVAPFQFVIDAQGRRQTSYLGYRVDACGNVAVAEGCTVERIIVAGSSGRLRARSVVLRQRDGRQCEITVSREVILAAGAIASPQLLMLSGIGPAAELLDHGIKPLLDAPGVGQNLQDDLYVTTAFSSKRQLPVQPYGLMGVVLFANTPGNDPRQGTDVECSLAAGTMAGMGLAPEQQQSYWIFPNIQRLASRGSVGLRSADPFSRPRIDPNYLGCPKDIDRCVAALKLGMNIGADAALAAYRGERLLPAPEVADLVEYVRETAGTCYHYAGTCKMGVDPVAVVSPTNLQVHGVDGLRVIDASVIPQTVSGNTAAAVMMIAERASAFIE